MRDNFEICLAHVLSHEGGYSDHPSDPGGATNLGITRAVLEAWRGVAVTEADVKALTRAEAAAIYRKRYWDAVRGDELPAGLDLAVFDCAVNQGVSRAAHILQATVGVLQDGKIGPITLAAVHRGSVHGGILEFQARRMVAYGLLASLFKVFGLGWARRLTSTVHAAISLHNSNALRATTLRQDGV
jgi:lysozyme family protein